MPQEPMSFFGWLMNYCVSEDASTNSPGRFAASEALVFASGMAAGLVTLYLAGLFHLI
jgi:hypothetical protein